LDIRTMLDAGHMTLVAELYDSRTTALDNARGGG